MLQLHCIKRFLLSVENHSHCLQYRSKYSATAGNDCDQAEFLRRLCKERYFISPDNSHNRKCIYGPLGTELKKNILEQWWISAVRSRARVFGIDTSVHKRACRESVVMFNYTTVEENFHQDSISTEEVLKLIFQNSMSVRSSLLPGALQQYIQALEIVSRKLPFGLAEIGLCHQSSNQSFRDSPGGVSEVTESSLVWFCSPRTSSQWMDYWARQRLQWWKKFALGPSDFSLCDVVDEDLKDGTLRGIKVLYKFPWGLEALETLWSLGSTALQKTYQGKNSKLQLLCVAVPLNPVEVLSKSVHYFYTICSKVKDYTTRDEVQKSPGGWIYSTICWCRDGRKVVIPHVISISGDIDKGMLAYLFNSLNQLKKTDSKQKLLQRTVLKLHPTLAPVKVALEMGRGSNSEVRQVCEGLLQEFINEGIPTWPGFLDSLPLSLENLHTKYDEMGVLFTVLVSETTLKNGLLLVRNRDTTIRETMHISEIKAFLLRYISASHNL